MQGIEQKNRRIYYYGNPAGYVAETTAVIDTMFQNDELKRWLQKNGMSVTWKDGVYERLVSGDVADLATHESTEELKSCRIWQLRPEATAWSDLVRFGTALPDPKAEDYTAVYDGQLDTNDLEKIYDKFTERRPPGFAGHPLSVADVVELYDDAGSAFYFLDRTRFRAVEFSQPEQAFEMTMTM